MRGKIVLIKRDFVVYCQILLFNLILFLATFLILKNRPSKFTR